MRRSAVIAVAILSLAGAARAQEQGREAGTATGNAMSCDDMIVEAELKIQPVIEQEEKAAAVAHVRAAQAAIAKGDTATCKAEIAKALAVAAKGNSGY